MGTSKSTRPIPIRTQSTAVLRVAIPPRPRRRMVATRGECAILQMVTLTVQQAAWEWEWGRTGTALGITHPSLFTRRREKIETINYPPLGTSIPIVHDPQKTREAVKAGTRNTGPTMIGVVGRSYIP